MADKRRGKIKKKVRKQLKRKIELKIAERKVVLDQLALLDAELDGIDEVINKLDKKIPPLVEDGNLDQKYTLKQQLVPRKMLQW